MRLVALAIATLTLALLAAAPSDAQQQEPAYATVLNGCNSGYQSSCDQLNDALQENLEFADFYMRCSSQFEADSPDQAVANVMAWLRARPSEANKPLTDAIQSAIEAVYYCQMG